RTTPLILYCVAHNRTRAGAFTGHGDSMRKPQILCVVVLLASACGSSPGPAAERSPSASMSPSAISSTPTATGSPSVSPASSPSPSTGVISTLQCRLPVISPVAGNEPPGGWMTFPGGEFVRDEGSLRPSSGYQGPSYDRAIGAWIPVEYQNVAPDGLSYVLYRDATTEVPNA